MTLNYQVTVIEQQHEKSFCQLRFILSTNVGLVKNKTKIENREVTCYKFKIKMLKMNVFNILFPLAVVSI